MDGAQVTGGTELHDAMLEGADLSYADFTDAIFAIAKFSGAVFRQANLTNANLERYRNHLGCGRKLRDIGNTDACPDCYPGGLNLDNMQFRNVNLAGANLKGSSCVNTLFEGSDLAGSNLDSSNFCNA